MRTLQAGFAEVVITPPVGTPMEGYSARQGVSQGVHDDLHARALVLDDGPTRVAIVSCDLLGVDRRLVAAARERAEAMTGIPGANVLVAATHTHAGPAGLRWDLDAALAEITARKIAGAVDAANRALEPAVIKVGRTSVDSVSQNRRDPAWPAETALRVLLVDRPQSDRRPPIAAVINFACHATVLFHTNLLLSADYPGAAAGAFRAVTGAPSLFLNGACGNVNPTWSEQEFGEAERVGAIVGSAAARLASELRPLGRGNHVWNIRVDRVLDVPVTAGRLVEEPRLAVASGDVDLPLRELQPPEEYEQMLVDLEARLAADGDGDRAAIMAEVTRYRTERMVAVRAATRPAGMRSLHPEVMAIALGEGVALLALPGEFFVETARAIDRAASFSDLFIACYANHYVGYVCPPEAFEQGGYEAGVTLFGPGADPLVREHAAALLRRAAASAG